MKRSREVVKGLKVREDEEVSGGRWKPCGSFQARLMQEHFSNEMKDVRGEERGLYVSVLSVQRIIHTFALKPLNVNEEKVNGNKKSALHSMEDESKINQERRPEKRNQRPL